MDIKYCDESDFENFAPSRKGQRTIIKHLKEAPNSLMCLDFSKLDGQAIEIYGSTESDET